MSKASKQRRATKRALAAPLRAAERHAVQVADQRRRSRGAFNDAKPGHGGSEYHGVFGFGQERSGFVRTLGQRGGRERVNYTPRNLTTGTVALQHGLVRAK